MYRWPFAGAFCEVCQHVAVLYLYSCFGTTTSGHRPTQFCQTHTPRRTVLIKHRVSSKINSTQTGLPEIVFVKTNTIDHVRAASNYHSRTHAFISFWARGRHVLGLSFPAHWTISSLLKTKALDRSDPEHNWYQVR